MGNQINISGVVNAKTFSQEDLTVLFARGQRVKFSTAGHSKAKGLSITIEYPKTWQAVEGERPNIVQKFVSREGSRNGTSLLMIQDLPVDTSHMTEKEMTKILSPEAIRQFIPNGGKFISGKRTKIDGLPGAWVVYTVESERAGANLRLYSITFISYFRNKLITLQCAVGGLASESSVEQEQKFKTLIPLFQLMANSIIVHDRYK